MHPCTGGARRAARGLDGALRVVFRSRGGVSNRWRGLAGLRAEEGREGGGVSGEEEEGGAGAGPRLDSTDDPRPPPPRPRLPAAPLAIARRRSPPPPLPSAVPCREQAASDGGTHIT